ncbi:MAG: RNase H-like domain-containing protein [Candidatus Thiodiazotropha endolucinida]|nr:DDE-type integrase/transposase/recombinase [Candidatus Thiodiazotropha taylori]MCW4260129.1 RNase H-like domain-containing protein [Candidatus Thiodiazotropha endolucinida]
MDVLNELKAMGESLGYDGPQLQEFIKEQQAVLREERAAVRQKEKEEREYNLKLQSVQLEKEKAEALLEIEKQKLEREVRLKQEEKESEIKLKQAEHAHEMEVLEFRAKSGVSVLESEVVKPKGPKLPAFEEGKDEMDSYLHRFERYAAAQNWKRELWATHLSALLKGRALDVYALLPYEKALDYDELKQALLKRFELTEDGFKRKFRSCRPEAGETFSQFSVRLGSYLNRWIEMSSCHKTYEGLFDLMMRDQLLHMCNKDLTLYLKERVPSSLQEMATLADQFKEARLASAVSLTYPSGSKSLRNNSKSRQVENKPFDQGKKQELSSGFHKKERRCFKCGSSSHIIINCPAKNNKIGNVTSDSNLRNASSSPARGRSRSLSPYPRVRFEDTDRGRSKKRETSGTIDQSKAYQDGTCGACSLLNDSIIDVNASTNVLKLTSVCTSKMSGMPVTDGKIGKMKVTVLRDTGCSGVVVRKGLLDESNLTGEDQICMLADGSRIKVPMAEFHVDTPYYVGKVRAWCMENPMYDLIVGNIDGARDPGTPDSNWEINAVQTRQQVRNLQKPYSPLKVPEAIKDICPEDIKKEQQEDITLRKVRMLADEGKQMKTKGNSEVSYIQKNGIVYRKFKSPKVSMGKEFTQLVVPSKFRDMVLKLAHETILAGHMSTARTVSRVLSEFYWPGVQSDTKRFCRSCDICQRTVPKGRISKVPLGKMPLIDEPFKRVAVDIIGPLSPVTTRGNRYILTLVDYATRYPEAVPLSGIETERVAEALLDIFCRIGFPQEMLTDMGAQFTSSLMNELCRLISLKQLTTTPYHPICNGLVERLNGSLKTILKRICAENPHDWDKYLNAALFAYREVPQESLGFAPFDLIYGRSVRGPMAILKELWSKDVDDLEVKSTYQYVVDLRHRLESVSDIAQTNLQKASRKQKVQYDKKARQRNIKVGDKVLVLLPKKTNKLLLQWKGPYTVVKKFGGFDFRIQVRNKLKTFHANLLKKYIEREVSSDIDGQVSVAVLEEQVTEGDGIEGSDLLLTPSKIKLESPTDIQISGDLTSEQKADIRNLAYEFPDVFTDKPGLTNVLEHEIRTTTETPVRLKPYPLPFAMVDKVNEEVDKMLEMDVIEPSESAYSSPIVLVRKKDQTFRFCIDLRALNRITIFDAEPMPNIDDLFSKLAGYKYFSKIDLSKGYWQVPLSQLSKHKTAFQTPKGLFQFKVMAFGLVSAPATFSRLMRKLLNGMEGLDNFLDDILIFSKIWTVHLQVLSQLLSRLRSASLTARPSKCFFGFPKLECLGHMVSDGRLEPNPDKVIAIRDAPRPETKRQIKSFLGLIGFYRRFVPSFSHVAAALTDLTKKGQPNKIKWGDAQENAFRSLKQALISNPILKLPDFTATFILQTDASEAGLGAVLLQEENGFKLPISYASRKLKQSEKSYSVIEKECLAVVWAIQKFSRYLYGKEFILETDHQPLVHLNRKAVANARLMRWSLALQPYRFRIMAIRGRDNVGADYLSRVTN